MQSKFKKSFQDVTECKNDEGNEPKNCEILNGNLEKEEKLSKRLKTQYVKVTKMFDTSTYIEKFYAPLIHNSVFQVSFKN